MSDEREPYDSDIVEIGLTLGHVTQLNSQKPQRVKKRNPVGFAPPQRRTRKVSEIGGRSAGSWPDVPRFDIREDS